jgi:hypothetical protein
MQRGWMGREMSERHESCEGLEAVEGMDRMTRS